MGKKKNKRTQREVQPKTVEVVFSDLTEKIFKRILRVMSWIVGICIIFIIIFPLFETPSMDSIARMSYYIGVFTLITFSIIELMAKPIKKKIEVLTK